MLTYAEIHYRPRYLPSLLYTRRPEIIFDAPVRVADGQPIPLFIVIKDAHLFPIKLQSINVRMIYEDGADRVATFPYDEEFIDVPLWWDAVNIIPEYSGHVTIDPHAVIMLGRHTDIVHVDNYKGSSLAPLRVYAASETVIPEGWYPGDVHCHSQYTSDQVEFGAPVGMLSHAAKSMGLSWIAITDHSYDLDDREDDYLNTDPGLSKWKSLQRESVDHELDVTIIPGEEVTCRNADGENCHMLALDARRFLHGSGDSGERGLRSETEMNVREAAAECTNYGGIACAAHPLEKASLGERMLLNRGIWMPSDLECPDIVAMQVVNGEHDRGFHDGLARWVKFLLMGRRIFILGGSDSHGDLNRQRGIFIPLIAIRERHIHRFGETRTVVRADSSSREDILSGISRGSAVVSEGPFIELTVSSGSRTAEVGEEIPAGVLTLTASFASTREYGTLRSARIFAGRTGDGQERVLYAYDATDREFRHQCVLNDNISGPGYVRAVCVTDLDRYCLTNPVWISGSRKAAL